MARNRRAAGKNQACQAAMPGQPQVAVEQQLILRVDHAALQETARPFDVLLEPAGLIGLGGQRQAQCRHIPGQQLRVFGKLELQVVDGITGVVRNRLQRQPLQPRAGVQTQPGALHGLLAVAFVKARGTGRGDQRMRTFCDMDIYVQHITAHQPARRVYQHVVADGRPLGIQAFEDAQRTIVREMHRGLAGLQGIVQRQLRMPGHCRSCLFKQACRSGPGSSALLLTNS